MLGHAGDVLEMAEDDMVDFSPPAWENAEEWENADDEEEKRSSDSLPSGDGETSVVATEQACVTGIVTPVTTTPAVGNGEPLRTVPCSAKTRCGKPYIHLDGAPWAMST